MMFERAAPQREKYDVVVIGSGASGLAAAIIMAKAKKSVLLVEQHYVAGGTMADFRRKEYLFDIGHHYLGECGPGHRVARMLAALGISDVEMVPLDRSGHDVIKFPDFTFRTPATFPAFRAALKAEFADESRGVDEAVDLIEGFAAMARGKDLQGSVRAIDRVWYGRTVGEVFDNLELSTRLRAVLVGDHTELQYLPWQSSFSTYCNVISHYVLDGAYYPKNGSAAMVRSLVKSLRSFGGELVLKTKALRIEAPQNRVRRVVLENKHWGTKALDVESVIYSGDVQNLLDSILAAPANPLPNKPQKYSFAFGNYVVSLGLRREWVQSLDLKAAVYFCYRSYDMEGCYRFSDGFMPDTEHVTMTSPSLKAPGFRCAPDGASNFQLTSVAPREATRQWTPDEISSRRYSKDAVYREKKTLIQERMLATAETFFPGIQDAVLFADVSTPLSYARYTLAMAGTGYGLAPTVNDGRQNRVPVETSVRGLHLCGAAVGGPGVGACVYSGINAARRTLTMNG